MVARLESRFLPLLAALAAERFVRGVWHGMESPPEVRSRMLFADLGEMADVGESTSLLRSGAGVAMDCTDWRMEWRVSKAWPVMSYISNFKLTKLCIKIGQERVCNIGRLSGGMELYKERTALHKEHSALSFAQERVRIPAATSNGEGHDSSAEHVGHRRSYEASDVEPAEETLAAIVGGGRCSRKPRADFAREAKHSYGNRVRECPERDD